MKNARETAVQALLRQSTENAYSNLVIDALATKNRLDARDAAFAAALFYGTLERRLTIDHILKQYSARPLTALSPQVRETLRAGVCQLVWMDGVDDYAAVNESVNLVKALGQAKASGFVNGVLRSFLRDGKRIPPVDGGRAEQLAVEYSCPAWLVGRWLEAYGEPACLRLLSQSIGRPPLYLRANTLMVSPERLAEILTGGGVPCTVETEPDGCIAVEGRVPIERLESFRSGLFHVQDRASQLCAAALDPQPGERVLDACAAPGGKSFTAAERMRDEGELVARDLHPKRAALVRQGAQRLGIECIRASAGDAGIYDPALGSFDRVLCDVPCSGFGVIRRRPEIKYKSWESVRNLPEIQYKILQTSSHYLKTGGSLVYSTCTLLPEENEQTVARFLEGNPEFTLESQRTCTGEAADTDGFFISVLKKR